MHDMIIRGAATLLGMQRTCYLQPHVTVSRYGNEPSRDYSSSEESKRLYFGRRET
jgi:hypothetical protein